MLIQSRFYLKNFFLIAICLITLPFILSCSEKNTDPVSQAKSETLIYEYPGLLDSLVGTCSTFSIRTFYLDTLDFTRFASARFQRNSFTDGDLSEIKLYYINSDTVVSVLSLQGTEQINNANNFDFVSPNIKTAFFIRLKLFSSVCTGQLFYLKLRDMNIYGLN